MHFQLHFFVFIALALSTPVFAQDIVIGPERPVSTPHAEPSIGPAAFIASPSGEFTFVRWWSDNRDVGVVLDQAGNPLTPVFGITDDGSGVSSVVWFAGRFIAALANAGATTLLELSPEGHVFRRTALPPELRQREGWTQLIAGTTRLLVLGRKADTFTPTAILLDTDLNVVKALDLSFIQPGPDTDITGIGAGTNFILMSRLPCSQSADTPCPAQISRIDESGNVSQNVAALPLPVSPRTIFQAGDRVFVAWISARQDLIISVLSREGSILVAPHVAFHMDLPAPPADPTLGTPTLLIGSTGESAAGAFMTVGWTHPLLLRISPLGDVTSSAFVEDPSDTRPATGRARPLRRKVELGVPDIQIVAAGGHLLGMWAVAPSAVAAPIGWNGAAEGEPVAFNEVIPSQYSHDVASSGSNALVVWAEYYPEPFWGTPRVVAARVGLDGAGLDGPGIFIRDNANLPMVAFDGEEYVVAWVENYQPWFARVALDGTLGAPIHIDDPANVNTANSERPLAVACDSGTCLLTWSSAHEDRAIHGTIIQRGEAGPVFSVSQRAVDDPFGSADYKVKPSVAASPDQFLVTWMYYCCVAWNPSPASGIFASRVSRYGLVLDPGELRVAGRAAWVSEPSAAWTGKEFFSTWSIYDTAWPPESRNPALTPEQIYGKGIDPTGALLDGSAESLGVPVSTAPGSQLFSNIACHSDCLVVWQDHRAHGDDFSDRHYDVYGTFLSPTGYVRNQDGFAIAATADSEEEPRIAPIGDPSYIIVYRRPSLYGPGPHRVYARVVTYAPQRTLRGR